MSYEYQRLRPRLFTEDGVEMLTSIRDNVRDLLKSSGAFQMEKAWRGVSGDCWLMTTCVDYLVEKGELREVSVTGSTRGQDRVFVSAKDQTA